MLMTVADETTDLLFRVQIEERSDRQVSGIWQISETRHDEFDVAGYARRQEQIADSVGGPKTTKPIRVQQKVGRNEPCPCGSGKKFKHCCGRTG
jgi:preprotein translocase subunit SecA